MGYGPFPNKNSPPARLGAWLPFALILLRAYQSNKTPKGTNA